MPTRVIAAKISMKSIQNIYLDLVAGVGESPSWKRDWRWIALYSVIVYAIVLAFRMSFAGRWDHPELWVNGERIMATHDAYWWLAKAKGVGQLSGHALAELAALLHQVFGFKLGSIGFWTPAVVGSLTGVACVFWGWLVGGRNAGIFAGLIGSLTPGFFYRSRLGYYDTDMFTLLGPLTIALMLAYFVSLWTKRSWFVSGGDPEEESGMSPLHAYGLALALGLATRFFCMWHYDILGIAILYFFLAVAVILINGRAGLRQRGLYGLTVFAFAAFPGASYTGLGDGFWVPSFPYGLEITYIVLACALVFVLAELEKRKVGILGNLWFSLLCLCIAVAITGIAVDSVTGVIQKLSRYFQDGAASGGVGDPSQKIVYPSIMQSIIEAKLVPLNELLERGAFMPVLGWLALVSSVVVVALRPAAVFLLPLIALQLMGMKIGVRFAMFGGAAMMIFLGAALCFAATAVARRTRREVIVLLAVQLVCAGAVMAHAHNKYSNAPLTPVVEPGHAEALIELGRTSPKDARVWTWWDWGYATQYYAGRETVVDGGKHAGKDVYPVGFALSTKDPRESNRMIRFSAQYPTTVVKEIGLSPDKVWDKIPRDRISEEMKAILNRDDYPAVPPQYLVVSWKDFTISKWITFYGNWDLGSGSTTTASLRNFKAGELGIDLRRGAVMNRNGGGGLVSDITILNEGGAEMKEYYLNRLSAQLLPRTRHLLINGLTKQSVLMDRITYNTLMRRLLTDDPNDPEISKYFKIVVDKLPYARIYEVVQ